MPCKDFSALHCPRRDVSASAEKETILTWNIEGDDRAHSDFNSRTGTFIVPVDGMYLLVVELIPIGSPILSTDLQSRRSVHYALRLKEQLQNDDDDKIESIYLDVGSMNLGQMEHLKAGTAITCIRMPGTGPNECVRLKVELAFRKRKRDEKALSKKELKRRKKKKREVGRGETRVLVAHAGRADRVSTESDDDDDSESDSEWEFGFESDSTSDELEDVKRGVGRMAKRFKADPNSGTATHIGSSAF